MLMFGNMLYYFSEKSRLKDDSFRKLQITKLGSKRQRTYSDQELVKELFSQRHQPRQLHT